jgi:hypothetical protein
MTRLLTGVLVGAATWGIYTSWLVPMFGWVWLLAGLAVLAVITGVLIVREPVTE